jgi:hypothetical protein
MSAAEIEQARQAEQERLLGSLQLWHNSTWHERAGELCVSFQVSGIEWYCKVSVRDDLSRVITCCWRPEGTTDGYGHLPLHLRQGADGRKIAHFIHGVERGVRKAWQAESAKAQQQREARFQVRQSHPEIVRDAWAACA